MHKLATLLLLALLSVSISAGLVACGQKGGLTRPDPATFAAASS